VEAINGHRGDRQKRTTMEFRVRWAGFGEICDSWEPYKALPHVDNLREYLRATNGVYVSQGCALTHLVLVVAIVTGLTAWFSRG
jgi:hypothetical protein